MAIRFAGRAALALAISVLLLAGNVAAAARHPAKSSNPANDQLLKLAPAERAALLARAVGHWCIGTETFLMGVVAAGPGEGNAYWSLRCADGSAWALQLNRQAQIVAIDCDSFKESGTGEECFKKF